MSRGWYYRPGTWNYYCDVCGTKYKATHSKERWDGLQVCPDCFELRHPQDFVRTKGDKVSVDWQRPGGYDWTAVPYITLYMATSYCEDQNDYVVELSL